MPPKSSSLTQQLENPQILTLPECIKCSQTLSSEVESYFLRVYILFFCPMSLCSIMNLWLSGVILFASLFLCSSAPTPEECNQLVKPLSFADPSVMIGRMHFIAGYTNHKVSKAILKITDSSWVNIKASPSSNTQVLMIQEDKLGGVCLGSTVRVTIDGDTARASVPNMNSVFHVLPSCNGCLLVSINSTARHVKEFLKIMKIKETFEDDELHVQSLYLLSREFTLTDSDLEHFKKQASCLGFSGEPDFRYNPTNSQSLLNF
uniref:Uncharacterized protein n=1 Tax=Nothobranchius furzeri TaxID=105023 RepID=A0A8C6MDK9_NOTFU